MKKIKILVLLLSISATLFYSCSDSNPIEGEVITSKSIALRTTLNEVKRANNILGKTTLTTQDQSFCFNFVYPITLSYNNGTQVSVASFGGLLEILTNENSALYIDGIAFPFQVQEELVVTTIHNEDEFYALIQNCTFHTVNSFFFDFTCYSIVYPIVILISDDQGEIINNQTELMEYLSTPVGSTTELNIEFPISVIQNGETIAINNLYEFFELNNDCNPAPCFCPTVYQPVCVQTVTGIVAYSNACFAECDGYTQSDFVDCNSTPCPCPTNFEPVCVQTVTGPVQFDNACRAECAGYTSADFITCGVVGPRTFGDLLGDCFVIHYPVQIQNQGALVTVDTDGQCLQYWFPAQSAIPTFNYPITVTFSNGITTTVASQVAFETFINSHCN